MQFQGFRSYSGRFDVVESILSRRGRHHRLAIRHLLVRLAARAWAMQ